jgi:hypothetical protein
LDPKPRRFIARALAGLAIGTAARLWYTVETGPAAAFIVAVGLMVFGSLVTLLGPLIPRVLWGTFAASTFAAITLGALGGVP